MLEITVSNISLNLYDIPTNLLKFSHLRLLYDTIMAPDSIFGSSTVDITSEHSQTSRSTRTNAGTDKERAKRSKIWDYCRELSESEARENGKLIYGCDKCAYKTNQTTNFRTHYFRDHGVDIPTTSGRAHRMKEAGQNLDDIMKLYSTMELQDKMLEDVLDPNAIEATLLQFIIVQNLSFRIVESDEFQAFVHALNRQALTYLPTSHNTVRTKVYFLP